MKHPFLHILATTLILGLSGAAQAIERPVQYVLLSFDGSYDNEFWKTSLERARAFGARYTYFASGPYFLRTSAKRLYIHPTLGAGRSAIGFGSTPNEIKRRVGWVNRAYREGHEIGSHVNGHYEGGSKWTLDQWESEFNQFYRLFFGVFANNDITSGFNSDSTVDKPFLFGEDEIIGYRAPFLETNAAMYQVLRAYHYRYDASQVTVRQDYWPEKRDGIWNFPLARVTLAGTGRRTISMDYNIYFSHSNAKEDLENAAFYEEQTYETLKAYFENNYYGNRAPVHIGFHFESWNGGAYMRAFYRLVQETCGKPEVKCVTYRELVEFMEKTPSSEIAQFRAGRFSKLPRPIKPIASTASFDGESVSLTEFWDADLEATLSPDSAQVQARVVGPDADRLRENLRFTGRLNGREINGNQINLREMPPTARMMVWEVSAKKGSNEVLKERFQLARDSSGVWSVHREENRALIGDLPEAHRR